MLRRTLFLAIAALLAGCAVVPYDAAPAYSDGYSYGYSYGYPYAYPYYYSGPYFYGAPVVGLDFTYQSGARRSRHHRGHH